MPYPGTNPNRREALGVDEGQLLRLLKADLCISSFAFDDALMSRIRTAIERIQTEGVTLGSSYDDQNLVVMYAAYLWRSRVDGAEMPRMLRYALNNRVFSQKAVTGS